MKNRGQMRVQFTILNWSPLQVSLVTQTVKHLPAMRETQVRSLGREDPLEKEMATHSSTLAWKIPWTEEGAGISEVLQCSGPGKWIF